jgi:hypothetical protein
MGLSAAEQKRHATVRGELVRVEEVVGELVRALSEDVEALGERVTALEARTTHEGEEWRVTCQQLKDLYLAEARFSGHRLEVEQESRRHGDESLWEHHRAFMEMGFWGRVGWLVRGR